MLEDKVRLHIRLLGYPDVSKGGIPLVFNQLKARALLYYLAATGVAHTRDHLATLLWSESGQSRAYHSLRSSLYHLRKALQTIHAEDVLVSEGDALGLNMLSCHSDLIDFHRLLKFGDESSLSQAVALYNGPLLQEFSVSDAPMFEDWVRLENLKLNHACLEALQRLTDWMEEQEMWISAIGYLQRAIQLDPFSDAAQQRLMRLYLKNGEAGLALRQYRQFENELDDELGITPSVTTKELYEEVLRQHGKPETIVSVYRPVRSPAPLPFVGREDLLHELSTLGEDVDLGHGTTILIQGEGGIGKSRLVQEFASQMTARPRPWIISQGACSPFDDLLSHGPFIEALQNGDMHDTMELLAESGTGLPDARGRFFWRVLQMIRSLSRSATLILFIDDLQWANSSTLNLFGFLSARIRFLPVMLVGTVQHADAIPALQRLITLGRRRHELRLLSLTPLSQNAIAELLRQSRFNESSIETLAEWLNLKSAGNPFLLSEILAQLRAEKILNPRGDGWLLDAAQWLRWRTTFSLSETTYDLVNWRLANISAQARNILDILAVASQPVPESVFRSLAGVWTDSFPTYIDDLSGRELVIEMHTERALALPHHLLRETLLHRLSNLRRRAIHRQLAEAMEAQMHANPQKWLRQVALHAVAGEDIDRSRHYGMKLLPDLPNEYTGAETIDFVHHLHDLLVASASAEEMILITRALGTLHQSLGHIELASRWHQKTLEFAQRDNNYDAQANAHLEMSELALISNNYRVALQAAEQGLEVIHTNVGSSSTVSIGRAYRLLGASLAMEGRDLAAAEEYLRRAVAAHREIENQGDLCAVLFELGNVAAQRGELERALDFYEESARVAEAERIHYYLALARNNFAYHSLLLGRVEAAQQSVAQGIKIAEAYDLLGALLHLYSTKGEISLYLERWEEAEESFRNGLVLAEELGNLERQAGYRGGLALVARGKKDFDASRQLLEEALALITEQGYWHLHTRLQLSLAETFLDQSRYAEAEKILREAMQVARSQQRTLLIEQGEHLWDKLLSLKPK